MRRSSGWPSSARATRHDHASHRASVIGCSSDGPVHCVDAGRTLSEREAATRAHSNVIFHKAESTQQRSVAMWLEAWLLHNEP